MTQTMLERASDLRDFVGSLARVRDDVGVLSVTIGIEPGAVSGGAPAWEIALENDLDQLRHDSALGPALKRREEVSTLLAELLDPTIAGRGRALYVTLESGGSSEVMLHTGLPTSARVGPVAHVLPLLQQLDVGEPAGLVTASRDAISVRESELGIVRDVEHIELEPWIGDWWPEMKGPARANPLRGQHTVSQRDRYARRVAEAYRHTVAQAVGVLKSLARDRGWRHAVLAGDPRRIDVINGVLQSGGLATTTMGANLEGLRTEEAVERLESALETLVGRENARLAEDMVSAENGVCGLVRVLAALNEARLARLLIDPSRTFAGLAAPGEILRACEEVEGAVDLTDLMVARALATDAAVTPLCGDATGALAACGGIAGLLRW